MTLTRHFLALFGLLVGLGARPVAAADAQGNYAVWGIGQASCHQFGKAYAAGELDAYKAYLAGYLTAYNATTEGAWQVTGQRNLRDNLGEIAGLCAQSPMDSFERAIQALIAKGSAERRAEHAGASWGRPAPAR
jgi:hypothetical protein